MSGAAAADYCGVTPQTFAGWIAAGIIPPAVPGTRRWDRKAIDMALDKASGIVAPSAVLHTDVEDEWERKYEARKAARKPPRAK